jgi:hypothetical protein
MPADHSPGGMRQLLVAAVRLQSEPVAGNGVGDHVGCRPRIPYMNPLRRLGFASPDCPPETHSCAVRVSGADRGVVCSHKRMMPSKMMAWGTRIRTPYRLRQNAFWDPQCSSTAHCQGLSSRP